jgi:hypothetical protein
MIRIVLLLLVLALGPVSNAQETTPEQDDSSEPATQDPSPNDVDAELEDELQNELEDESYIDAKQDDFRPSEEIPLDQSIAFPTDI